MCARIEQLLCAQDSLVNEPVPDAVERAAQHCVTRLIAEGVMQAPGAAGASGDHAGANTGACVDAFVAAAGASGQLAADSGADSEATVEAKPEIAPDVTASVTAPVFVEILPDSLDLMSPRSIGVEHVALAAMHELGFERLLVDLGVSGVMRTAIIGSIVARMAAPGSELASHRWLTGTSGLGDLLPVDLPSMPLERLYRASDVLMKHHEVIETTLFSRLQTLFSLGESVTLYDLTHTYFEGSAAANGKAARGRSKEKRSDCPLVTLGVVCDGSGFIRRSQVFAGNAMECRTLEKMLLGLAAPPGALIILDRGIATEANIVWLRGRGYRYLVVSRERNRHFDAEQAVDCVGASGETVRLVREWDEPGEEVRLFCHSERREQKERGMVERFCQRFEQGLTKLAAGLLMPRGEKQPERVHACIGALKARCRGAGQYYTVAVEMDAAQKTVTALRWAQQAVPGSMLSDPAVYCLRSNELDWDEERLLRTDMTLTDLEAVFRSLKGELGLRPIFHSKEERTDGHLFISVLAYQFVQVIRRRLKMQGITMSWGGLREVLSVQRRVRRAITGVSRTAGIGCWM